MSEYKVIDYRLHIPHKSLFDKKGKARLTLARCKNSENCSLYAEGKCALWSGLPGSCKYGYKRSQEGYTTRARKYSEWIHKKEDKYSHIEQLDPAPEKITVINEWVYFPYPHWYLIRTLPEELQSSLGGSEFIPLEMFTPELFQQLVNGSPKSWMGGYITSYTTEVVPKMVQHLEEQWSEIYEQWEAKYPDTAQRFKNASKVGRKAQLVTLTPPIQFYTGKKKHLWTWDGQTCFCDSITLFNADSPAKYGTKHRVEFTPDETTVIEVQSDDHVNPNTIFVD